MPLPLWLPRWRQPSSLDRPAFSAAHETGSVPYGTWYWFHRIVAVFILEKGRVMANLRTAGPSSSLTG